MKHNLKTAIIGCGGISAVHIASIKEGELSKIVAVCDTNGERLLAASLKIPGVATYSDYRELLDARRADVVHICTPHYLHAEMAIRAMETGHDVYLEKPCAMTPEEAEKILEVEKRTGKRVCVSFQNRVVPTTLALKSVIEGGTLGKLLGMKGIVAWKRDGAYYTESGWRGAWATEGGGTLMNQSIHTLDLICSIGGEVEKVEGTASLRLNRGTIEVEDTAEATITFKSGVTAIFYATNCHKASSPIELECIFEKGSVLIRDDAVYMIHDGICTPIAENGKPGTGKLVWGVGHARMIDSFYTNLDGTGTPYYCTLAESAKVLDVIADIYRSSAACGGLANPNIK